MTIISRRRRPGPADVSAEQHAAWAEAEVRRVRAEAEAAREIRAAELEAARSERETTRADEERERYARAQRRAERAETAWGVAQRTGRRVVLVGPIILVNALALGGQIGFARAHLGWDLPAAIVFACALESIAIYVGWHAHAALLAGDSASKLRAASYLVAGIVAGINYEHYSVRGAPSVPAVTFGLMSLLSPWLWSIHSRYEHRAQLRAAGLIDQRAAHFASAKWLWFPLRTLGALRWSVDHGVQDPAAAWAGHAASRIVRTRKPVRALPAVIRPELAERAHPGTSDVHLSPGADGADQEALPPASEDVKRWSAEAAQDARTWPEETAAWAAAAERDGHKAGVPAGVPDPDPLLVHAATVFSDDIRRGVTPSIRRIKSAMRIGQPKAGEVRAYLSVLADQ